MDLIGLLRAGPPRYVSLVDGGFLGFHDVFMCAKNPAFVGVAFAALRGWITGRRQAVEWGIGYFKRTFSRLYTPLTSNAQQRRDIIELAVFLYNFRALYEGGNEIKSRYMVALEERALERITGARARAAAGMPLPRDATISVNVNG